MDNWYTYTQGDILIEPYNFLKILELKVVKGINQHGKFYIKGIISDEFSDEYVENAGSYQIIKASLKDDKENITKIFHGIVTHIAIDSFNNIRTLEIEAQSETFLMDLEKKSRSFQGDYVTYSEIFNNINKSYGDAKMVDYVTNSETIDNIIVQYNETDWEFLKRLASHFNTGLIPECTLGGVKYFIGDDGPGTVYELDEFNYSINKGLKEYKLKSSNSSYELNDINFLSYEVVTNRIFNSLTSVSFKGRKLSIYKSEFTLVKGMLSNKYILRDSNGVKVKKMFNENIVGTSLEGYILDVKNDIVKVSLKIDGYSNSKDTTVWLPYSTVFSSPDGTGWYCMPEVNDAIRLYFPDNVESNAYAISSVNLQSSNSSKRSDPSVKSIGTKYGKEIIMRPGAIDIISSNNSMRLSDSGGIQVNSNNQISMSGSSVNISGGYVSIQGSGGVTLSQSGASITIKDNITMKGMKINTQ
ncbi:hypothetical protein UT300005_25020 [Clostridium sp. CTA-5]